MNYPGSCLLLVLCEVQPPPPPLPWTSQMSVKSFAALASGLSTQVLVSTGSSSDSDGPAVALAKRPARARPQQQSLPVGMVPAQRGSMADDLAYALSR